MLVQTLRPGKELTERYSGPERRAVVRFYCDREASYSSLNACERFSVRVRDISVQGIGLVLGSVIARGTEIAIDMKTKPRGASLTLLARVVHSTMREDGSWIVGCEFITKPTEAQIRSLL